MLKKLRRRFIASAMGAIFVVVLVLAGGMNLWNYHLTTQRQDDILLRLMEQEQTPPAKPDGSKGGPGKGDQPHRENQDGDFPLPGLFGGHSPEFRYMLRFFSVQCDANGKALKVDQEFIATVSEAEAMAYAEQVTADRRTSGYLNGYRYLVQPAEGGSTVLFLNSEREIQSMRTLLLVSLVVAAASLLATFVLVVLFSKRAIAPYIRNIETQKRFITDAGHELKTPLTAISASADVLAIDDPQNMWVTSIQAECAKMTRLVGNLVTLSRLDEEDPFPDMADFSLSDAVWETAEPMESLAKAQGKRYETSIADDVTVHGDRRAIQQMTSILLDNAFKYSDDGALIRLSLAKVSGKAQLQVFNTCDGSAISDVSRLFDRFYRPDSSRSSRTGGTGIGLSIAKATAEHHGGTIDAKLTDGGILFTVRL